MEKRNASIEYLSICMTDIPNDFQPLNSKEAFSNESSVGIKEILIYLANLQNDNERMSALSDIIDNSDRENEIAYLKKALSSVIEERFVRLFASYIFSDMADSENEKKDIFMIIETACMLASKYAECLCDPTGIRPSGMENRDIVTAMIGSTSDIGIAFKTMYRPIIGYCGESFTYIDTLVFEDMLSIVNMAVLSILKSGETIHKCRNCGDYFIPSSRSDEIYCDKKLPNGKTCKTVGYDERIKGNMVLREYRKIYKTQNARKRRNQHRKNISQKFQEWTTFAKEKVAECQSGKITIDEMISIISSGQWMQ